MKKTLIFLITLFAFTAFSQQVEIPKSYNRKINREAKKVRKLEKKHDIVLQPIESIPLPQSYSQINAKNWGLNFLEIDQYKSQIKAKKDKRKVLVVVFDTGGEYNHPSLLKAALKGYSYTGEPLKDGHGHSTYMAGIIASNMTNIGVGQILIEDGLIKLLPIKMLHNGGFGDMPEIIISVDDVIKKVQVYLDGGWFVIFSNSWGGGLKNKQLDALYKIAEEKGILITAASGNNGSGLVGWPAASEYIESVGALEENGNRAPYSQYGEGLDFTAPGSRIYSTWKSGSFGTLSGTSPATAFQSALYALTASYWPKSTAKELKAHFRKYSKDLPPTGYDRFTGFGASLIGALINNKPDGNTDNPDNPDDPGDDDVVKKERTITMPLNDLEIVWGIGNFKDRRTLKVELVMDVLSERLAELTYDDVKAVADQFFFHRGLLFLKPSTDFYDAQEWTAKFFYRHADVLLGEKYWLDIVEIRVTDNSGRTIIRAAKDLRIKENEKVNFNEIPQLVYLD